MPSLYIGNQRRPACPSILFGTSFTMAQVLASKSAAFGKVAGLQAKTSRATLKVRSLAVTQYGPFSGHCVQQSVVQHHQQSIWCNLTQLSGLAVLVGTSSSDLAPGSDSATATGLSLGDALHCLCIAAVNNTLRCLDWPLVYPCLKCLLLCLHRLVHHDPDVPNERQRRNAQ